MRLRTAAWLCTLGLLAAGTAGGAARQALDLTVEAPPALEPLAQRVRDLDRQQLARALRGAGLEVPPRVHVALIPENHPRARATPPWVAGLAFGSERIEIFPQRVSSYPFESLEAVVRHEIVHVALTARAGGHRLPRWFHEGVAVTVEAGWGLPDELRLLIAALDRPTVSDVNRLFASDRIPETTQAYRLSAAVVEGIRQRHGAEVPGAIASRVAEGLPFERAFERATGETVDEAVTRAWTGYRRVSRWIPAVTSPSAVWTLILALSFIAFFARIRQRLQRRRRWADEDLIDE